MNCTPATACLRGKPLAVAEAVFSWYKTPSRRNEERAVKASATHAQVEQNPSPFQNAV